MLLAAGAGLAFAAAPAAAAAPDAFYVFGDSLVDAGNVWIGSGFAIPPASQGYFQGRFTNGPDWTDILSAKLYGAYTTPYLGGGENYAVGGARAAGDAVVPAPGGGVAVLPGLQSQVTWYGGKHGPVVDPNGLYIISFGNNDASAINEGDTYGLTPDQYGDLFANNIASAAGFALSQGARVFVGGVPKPFDPVSLALESKLDAALDPLSAFYGDQLIRFSYADFFTDLTLNPTAYGLPANTDFNTPCLAVRTAVNGKIDCTGFFSFDGTHPTAPVQFALARKIAPLIGVYGVPEPANWALLIAGFGLVGAALRRRAAVAA
jgi:phospholipase/lecithinase/hemolysin